MTDLATRVARLNDVLCAVNALVWDSRTMMPRGGAETRGHQVATLKGLASLSTCMHACQSIVSLLFSAAEKYTSDGVLVHF